MQIASWFLTAVVYTSFAPHPGQPNDCVWLSYDWRQHSIPVVTRTTPPTPDDIVSTAEKFLGVPYSWGGTGASGLDCSGFINKIYAENGYDLPRVSREQVLVGLDVSPLALQTADVLFFSADPGASRITHVALYVRDGTFIHAATGKGEVSYDRLTERYYAARLVAARRILALPPGRYSTLQGGAAAGVMFFTPAQLTQFLEHQQRLPMPLRTPAYAAAPPRSDAAPGVETVLTEHAPDSRPLQLAPALNRGAVVEVGPALLLAEATRVGLRLGGGDVQNAGSLWAIPEFSYFGHDNALQVDMAAPFAVRVDGTRSAAQDTRDSWRTAADWGRVLRTLTFGQKEANVYVSLGRTTSQTLGDGQIMRHFTPNVASRYLPAYLLHANALSLAADLNLDALGGSVFVDDVFSPRVLGLTAYARPAAVFDSDDPVLQHLSMSATYAVDVNDLVHAVGVTLDGKVYENDVHAIKTYADVSALLRPDGVGAGLALGGAWSATFGATKRHALRLRGEFRVGSAGFLPSYFDFAYALDRLATPVGDAQGTSMTKLQWLQTLAQQSGRLGFYTEATYRVHRLATLGAAYEDGRPFSAVAAPVQYPSRSLMLFVQVRNLYIGGNGRALHFHIAYDLRHFEAVLPLLSAARGNEYVFATASLDINNAVQINGSVRKALNPGDLLHAAVDAALDLTFHYEL